MARKAKAMWKFAGREETELSLGECEIVIVLREDCEYDDWFYGKNSFGKCGYFPAAYVQLE